MTQPAGPYPFEVQTGPAAAPGAPFPPASPPGIDWQAIQAREATAAPPQADTGEIDPERQAFLEAQHGSYETAATQFARGALDALLAPGALVGLQAEAAGELLKNKALRDFGRDLGKSASGRSAAEALEFVFGGGGQNMARSAAGQDVDFEEQRGALERSEHALRQIDEQEEARPTLAMVSRIAGMASAAIGMGAGAVGESGAAAAIGANVAEGAAGGAQAAYEKSAPLRDVLASAAIGGVLSGAITGAAEGVQAGLKRAPDLARVFGDKVQEFADARAVKSVVGRDPKAWRAMTSNGTDTSRIARVAERIRAEDIIGKSDEGMLDALEKGAARAGDDLDKVAAHLDESGIAPQVDKLMAAWDEQIARLKSSGSGTQQSVADALEREVAPFKRNLAVMGRDSLGNDMIMGYRNPTFVETRELRTAIGKATKWHQTSQSMATDEMQRLYQATSRELSAAADQAGPEIAGVWRRANEAYSDFVEMSDALGREVARKVKNRYVSPSDYGTGIASALATAVMGGNPISAIALGAAGALGHKALREGGSAALSSLANRFARMSRSVSVKGVGDETREVLGLLARSRAFIDDTAERAGANPTLRQAAQETAQQVVAQEVAKKAGAFVPSDWAAKPLSAVQKLVYRGQILDAVASDISAVAKATEELRMPMPARLDPKRIARLAKNARGQEAIGSVQSTLGSIAEQAPPTPLGDAAGVALRDAMGIMDRTDVAETMARAHELVGWLDQAAASAADEASQNFATRASEAIRAQLSGDAFGEAGKLYRQMAAGPSDAMKAIQDEAALRESLRKYDETGHLPAIIKRHNDDLANAYGARFRLSGEEVPRELGEAFKRTARLFDAADRAVTLDGRGVARVFDAANAAGVYGAGRAATEPANERTVQDALDPEIDKIVPILRGVQRGTSQVVPRHSMTPQEQRAEYDQRTEQLARAVANPTGLDEAGHPLVAAGISEKLAALLRDMPKPTPSIRGKAFETMSSEDIRLANSMWEATTKPLSVFSDFAAGAIDYDKVQYAWKQWPGLQQAAQAGVMDVLTSELDEDDRAKLPDSILTQLDYLLGLQGKLQPTIEHGFGVRMSALWQPDPNKPPPGGTLQPTPSAEPTYTQRLAGAT